VVATPTAEPEAAAEPAAAAAAAAAKAKSKAVAKKKPCGSTVAAAEPDATEPTTAKAKL